MEFVDLKAQYEHLKQSIDARIHTVLDHGKYILGPEVDELEQALADYVGVPHVITCANGTDALQLCLMAKNIGPGDAVFCPTFTFFATAEVISLCGATPIFVDVDLATFNIDPNHLEAAIQDVIRDSELVPKAIIAVDLFGLPADYVALNKIVAAHNLFLIEDGAQGFGGNIGGTKACSFGDVATTSFFPAKPLGCYGDGGAIFTHNEELAELFRSLRFHGKGADKYDNVRIGLNSRLDTIQAAILLEKLVAFPWELTRRQAIADRYNEELGGLNSLITPKVGVGYSSSWAQYTLQTPFRAEAQSSFGKKNIPSAIYYPAPMHKLTAFRESNSLLLPNAEHLSHSVLSLPMHPYLKPEEQSQVIETLQHLHLD